MVPTQAHRIQSSLRSFKKAISTPTYSLHKGVTHLRGETGRDSAYTLIFEEPSTQAAASLLPLLPSWGTRVRSEGLALAAHLSVFSGSKCISKAPYGWLRKCYSLNPTSPPPELTQGAGIRKPPWFPTQATLSSLVLPTIQLIC